MHERPFSEIVSAHARSIHAACYSFGARGMRMHRMFLLAN